MRQTFSAFALALACMLAAVTRVAAASPVQNDRDVLDRGLLEALRSDRELQRCDCIRGAIWLNESYPRITVDAIRWKRLNGAARIRFGAQALTVAEATYLTQFGTPDQYEQLFVVDERGQTLLSYQPRR